MRIHIIPEPKYMVSEGNDSKLCMKTMQVRIGMTDTEERLLLCGRELFETVKEEESQIRCYYLICGLQQPDQVLAARSFGRTDGYSLRIEEESLEIYSETAHGLFYGMMTVKQLSETYPAGLPCLVAVDWADMSLRSDYMDLRTLYPIYDNILESIRRAASFKLNTLVIEYEDKLPFQTMKFLRHPDQCFTEEQFKEIQKTAYDHFITVIPLQQSFGHLEYVLKHKTYQYLRETAQAVGEMCPLREGALEVSRALLTEMAELHPDAKWLHMGCDEVWSLGSSRECRESAMTREQIFIEYVNQLTEIGCSLGKKPIIWHDMMEKCSDEDLAHLDKRVTVAVWIYSGNNLAEQAVPLIRRLRALGIQVIGASSVRCYDFYGDQNYPVAAKRIANLDRWSKIAVEEQLEGLINTNWASPFSFGKPYGLYESAYYTIIYGAERCWSEDKGKEDFLDRFFHVFHGVEPEGLAERGYLAEDYYRLIPNLMPRICRNRTIARLLEVMIQYEEAAFVGVTPHHQMFRCAMFPDREEEALSLKDKEERALKALTEAKVQMEEILAEFLTPPMAELFLQSRFYVPKLYEKEISRLLKAAGQKETK
ncbi:MAG: family 20 glycosylhydrolase [Lachnospiraceae bacterium]|nr:family 20 glycosylhydrolase [Lachnospiraceae bacterium]